MQTGTFHINNDTAEGYERHRFKVLERAPVIVRVEEQCQKPELPVVAF